MKTKTLVLSLAVTILFLSSANLFSFHLQQVNSILGDISFVTKSGYQPDNNTDEILRIKTHLEYVEALLRNKNTSDLSPKLVEKRNHVLNVLHEYLKAEIFPRNYDYKDQRISCFIDKDGRICAVGYLIEKTSGRQTAEQINDKYKYALIQDMNDETVDYWIENSGLTKIECAMIQPTYEEYKEYGLSTSDIVISTTFIATNLTFNTLNAMKISSGGFNSLLPIIGIVTGTAQVVYGAVSYPSKNNYNDYSYINFSHDDYTKDGNKILSAINIGIGASTIILSVLELLDGEKAKKKKTSWNFYSYPSKNEVGLGLSLTHKF
ncbi:MAG: hypothetical protein M3R36_17995 [Bacteroidota bacterium]|nr:hypothetical protein [Bacteroidota bacterium]